MGFHLWWLPCCKAQAPSAWALVVATSRLSSCSSWALELGLSSWNDWVTPLRLVGSSQTRDTTRVPCIGRWILNHWIPREVLEETYLTKGESWSKNTHHFFFWILFIYIWLLCIIIALHRLSLFVMSRGFSLLRWLLLLWSSGFRHTGFSGCGTWAWLSHSVWDLPRPWIKPLSPALAGGFLTIGS